VIGRGVRRLLVGFGCALDAASRALIPFAEMGCRVTGVEPVRHAVEVAKRALAERKLEATVIVGSVEDVPLDGDFDVIMSSYHCYSDVFDSSRRVELRRKLRRHLAKGGRVALTCHGVSNQGQHRSRLLRSREDEGNVAGGLSSAPLAGRGGTEQLGRSGYWPQDTSESEPVS
jgi:SAM-dependent methyltransferase